MGSVGEVVGMTDGTFVAGVSVLSPGVRLVDVAVEMGSIEVALEEEDVVETEGDVPVLIDQSVTSKLQIQKS